ncbi:MAG: DUF4258 domain-containing protein [Terrimicrobiaceae bacterium]
MFPVARIRFHLMAHFVQRMALRDLSLENVKNVISYPDLKSKSPGGLNGRQRWVFEKRVDGTTLKVVADVRGADYWIVTAYEL